MIHRAKVQRLSVALAVLAIGCSELPSGAEATMQGAVIDSPAQANARAAMRGKKNVIEVIARHEGSNYVFDLSASEVPSGWTTFDLDNQTHTTHFVYLAKVPEYAEDVTLDDWVENVTVPFQAVMDGLNAGAPDAFDHFEDMAGYFFDAAPSGGPGFTAGFINSSTTVHLEPGVYVLECYVKNAEGQFHSSIGMIEMLTVTEEANGAPEPRGNARVTVSTQGIHLDRPMRPGSQTVEVHWEDQGEYSHLLGHDVHLIRLDEGASASDVAEWMNWMLPEGLESSRSTSLGPATFIGGAQTMTPGSTGYIDVQLKPGHYAWVSEVPAEAEMWLEFTVPSRGAPGAR